MDWSLQVGPVSHVGPHRFGEFRPVDSEQPGDLAAHLPCSRLVLLLEAVRLRLFVQSCEIVVRAQGTDNLLLYQVEDHSAAGLFARRYEKRALRPRGETVTIHVKYQSLPKVWQPRVLPG